MFMAANVSLIKWCLKLRAMQEGETKSNLVVYEGTLIIT